MLTDIRLSGQDLKYVQIIPKTIDTIGNMTTPWYGIGCHFFLTTTYDITKPTTRRGTCYGNHPRIENLAERWLPL